MRTTTKLSILLFAILVLTGSASALSITFQQNTTEVLPGTTQHVGSFNISIRNETVNLTQIVTNLPFNASYSPSALALNASCQPNSSCGFQNQSIDVYAAVPSGFSPGRYPADSIFVFENRRRIERQFTVTVPRHRRWLISNSSTLQNLSVGTEAEYGSITISNYGNVETTLELNATGNISDYLIFNRRETVLPGFNRTITLKADVPRKTAFGTYTGQFIIKSRSGTQVLNLSTYFQDEIAPQIRRVEMPDLMATTEQTFHVVTTDNLDVANVSATIFRPVEVQEGNTTKIVNQTFQQVVFQPTSRSNVWNYTLRDTSQRGVYFVNVTVVDAAGNRATETAAFRISRLNASHVLHSNFIFDRVQPRDNAVMPVLRNDIRTPVTLTLDQWSHSVNDSQIWIGVRKPGDEVPVKFEGEGNSITVRQPGVYELVVQSDVAESYQGRIRVDPVEEHVALPPIVFSGRTDLQYPSSDTFTLQGLRTRIEVFQNESTGKEYVRMVTTAPASKCQGVASWSDCIETRSPGVITEVRKKWDRAVSSKKTAWRIAGLVVLFSLVFVGYVVKENRLEGRFKYLFVPKHDERYNTSMDD